MSLPLTSWNNNYYSADMENIVALSKNCCLERVSWILNYSIPNAALLSKISKWLRQLKWLGNMYRSREAWIERLNIAKCSAGYFSPPVPGLACYKPAPQSHKLTLVYNFCFSETSLLAVNLVTVKTSKSSSNSTWT